MIWPLDLVGNYSMETVYLREKDADTKATWYFEVI